ncbi:GyrI-like domain-containing protein [Rhodococcoides kroppenstedtii]|uniref:GyrI-like domain-containing protein n=1 Tax=Rhodococcoides kroppenstedtii TaxID=293050 RepID=UPI0009ED2BDC|nr:GyrI-like domain-containing protein [Rhodococcus kroppenstedtii]
MSVPFDPRRELTGYTARRGRVDLLELPARRYLAVDGSGDPNTSSSYADALASLYPVTYGLKFLSSRELGRAYRVPPLEALWWADDMKAFTAGRNKDRWHWTVLTVVPEWITDEHVGTVLGRVRDRAGGPPPRTVDLRTVEEGTVVQTLHVGPYDDEGPVIAAMHDDAAARGRSLTGRHHEIYLNDARRTAPERLRTILRQPVTGS